MQLRPDLRHCAAPHDCHEGERTLVCIRSLTRNKSCAGRSDSYKSEKRTLKRDLFDKYDTHHDGGPVQVLDRSEFEALCKGTYADISQLEIDSAFRCEESGYTVVK